MGLFSCLAWQMSHLKWDIRWMYSVVEGKVTKRVTVSDLIRIPVCPKSDKPKRKQPKKVRSWHLSSDESLAYIEDSNKKQRRNKGRLKRKTMSNTKLYLHRKQKRDTNKNVKKTVSVLPKKQVRHTGVLWKRYPHQKGRGVIIALPSPLKP